MPTSDPSLDYSLSFELRKDYLYVYVSGEKDSYEISRRYWLEIAGELEKSGLRKVLVEEDITEAASVSDVFQLVSELVGMGFAGKKIAFYDTKIEHHELNDFGALVGTNRGLNGQVFNDLAAADAWLVGES